MTPSRPLSAASPTLPSNTDRPGWKLKKRKPTEALGLCGPSSGASQPAITRTVPEARTDRVATVPRRPLHSGLHIDAKLAAIIGGNYVPERTEGHGAVHGVDQDPAAPHARCPPRDTSHGYTTWRIVRTSSQAVRSLEERQVCDSGERVGGSPEAACSCGLACNSKRDTTYTNLHRKPPGRMATPFPGSLP